ncbi:MAG: hypothetical protein U0Q18_24705 [Bryobacteraceae bacterium]
MHGGDSETAPKPHERVAGLHIVAAEMAFLLVPFVVIGFAYLYKGDLRNALYTPYWSIASSVLIGQALIRFIIRLIQSNAQDPAISWERVTVIFSVLIVLGLIPSLIVLLLVLISTQPSMYLAVAQLVLFVFGFSLYLAFGWTGQDMVSNSAPSEEFSVELDIATANVPRSYKKASGE